MLRSQMSCEPSGREPSCPSVTVLSLQQPFPFCHPEQREGSAVLRTFLDNAKFHAQARTLRRPTLGDGRCFVQGRSGIHPSPPF
jgi:hypothetical protein